MVSPTTFLHKCSDLERLELALRGTTVFTSPNVVSSPAGRCVGCHRNSEKLGKIDDPFFTTKEPGKGTTFFPDFPAGELGGCRPLPNLERSAVRFATMGDVEDHNEVLLGRDRTRYRRVMRAA